MIRTFRLRRILLAVILGAATTVAVAWFLAARVPWNNPRLGSGFLSPRNSEVSSVAVNQAWQGGALIRQIRTITVESPALADFGSAASMPSSDRQVEILNAEDVDTSWGLARKALPLAQPDIAGTECAHGWPLLALYWWRDTSGTRSGGTFLRIHGDDPWSDDARILPTLPIMRGVLINTLCFGALWWFMLLAPFAARASWRRRRGRCPSCGYDLSGQSGCSECGWKKQAPTG